MTRTRLCLYLLLLTPLAVYWPTVFHEYGLRDDYANLVEAHDTPGKLVNFTASQGRPLYGALLETSLAASTGIETFMWLRLTSVLLLTLLGIGLWRQLYQSGWTEVEALVIGLGVTLLPASQVITGWAITWPYVLSLLLGVAGFSAVEAELERGGLKRMIALIGGAVIYALAALIYQSNALFAIVPIAAVLLVRPGREPYTDGKWSLIHLGTLVVGLLVAYGLIQFLFHSGIFQASTRMQIETSPFSKLGWFFWQPLPNALALFALRDDFNVGVWYFWTAVVAVLGLIGYAYRIDSRRVELPPIPPSSEIGVDYEIKIGQAVPLSKTKWMVCALVLPLLAQVISLVAAERSTGYRTIFALSTLVLVLLVYMLRCLRAAGKLPHFAYYAGMVVLIGWGAWSARDNAFTLLAEPQNKEWEMIRSAVMRADFRKPVQAYVVVPQIADRSTERIYSDEFGSLSSTSDWAPKAMFATAVGERYPEKLPKGGSYTVTLGTDTPTNSKTYDVVIDMRRLKQTRTD